MPRKETAPAPIAAAQLAYGYETIAHRLTQWAASSGSDDDPPAPIGDDDLEDIVGDILNLPSRNLECRSSHCRVHIRPLTDYNTRVDADRINPSKGSYVGRENERYGHQLNAINDRALAAADWFNRIKLVDRSPADLREDVRSIQQMLAFVVGMSDGKSRDRPTDAARIHTNDYLDRLAAATDRLSARIERERNREETN